MSQYKGLGLAVSETEALILDALSCGKMYGLEIVTATEGRVTKNEVYIRLDRMQKKGYIIRTGNHYRPTHLGDCALAAYEFFQRELYPDVRHRASARQHRRGRD